MSGVNSSMDMETRTLEQAEAWFARRLADEDTGRADFERWIAAAPAHQVAWEQTRCLWDRLGAYVEGGALADFVDEAVEPEPPQGDASEIDWTALVPMKWRQTRARPRARRRFRFVTAAAIAGLALTAALFGARNDPPQIYTADANGGEIRLSDGSRVRLDVGARLKTEMGWRHRNVRILHGRADFDVVHDARRPFVVHAGAEAIRVLGTRFQVDLREQELIVTLIRGSVRIDSPEGQHRVRLRPGEEARWSASTGHWTRSKVDAEAATSWTKGFHVFDAMPLGKAVLEINRYSQRKMRLADPSLSSLELSGSFRFGDASGIANALPYVLPVKVQADGNEIVVSRR